MRMGKANRQRRRAKQIKQRQEQRTRAASRTGSGRPNWGMSPTEAVEFTLLGYAHRDCDHLGPDVSPLLHDLVGGMGLPRGKEIVARCLGNMIARDLEGLGRAGWEREELVRAVRRLAGAAPSAMIAGLLCGEGGPARRGAPGQEQVLDSASASWRADLFACMDAFAVLEHLPELPDLLSTVHPHAQRRSVDEERLLARVRALLAKAESTEFDEEADAYTTKAQELMTRHCIDRALLEDDADEPPRGAEVRRVWLEDPYLQAKAILLAEVAVANHCRAVVSPKLGFSTIVGHATSLDLTELLFTSLLVQATKRMAALGGKASGSRARRPAFRRSFLVSYAGRIGARLREANSAATAEAEEVLGSRLLPVLARRDEDVDDMVRQLFGRLGQLDCSATDLAGWAAGAAAADMADLAVRETLFEAAS
jgi:hypothetical protein